MTAADGQHGELERRLHQHALLAEIGRRALADRNLDALFTDATRLCALGLGVRYCKVLEYLPDQNRLLVRAGVGWEPGVVGHATLAADLGSPAGYALHTGKPVISNHLADESRFRTPELLIDHHVERAVNVILFGSGQAFGVLEADSEAEGVFSEYDVDFLQGVANLLGLALERYHVEDELRKLNERLEERVTAEVAERRLAEDALRQAQKMEAIGQLTGGVAHDFNNLLLVITGSLDMIAREVEGNPRLERLVATAQKGASRGAQLTGQLLAFARRQTLRPETLAINELISEIDVLATRMLGGAIDTDFQLDPTAGSCYVDPAQFGSAVLNLIVNARDAMPDGGSLTIRTGNLDLDPRAASLLPDARPGSYVFLEVADTGPGMTPEILNRATEPFFTTKETGKGTGLGLSQVHGFVHQSGGFLLIESAPGVGTRVRIHLARAPRDVRSATAADAGAQRPSQARTILVVEDDTDVRLLVTEQLEGLGYRVAAAASGQAAMDLLDRDGVHVDLVLTDVVMPGGMSGLELARALRTTRPDLTVVLTSGFMSGNAIKPGGVNGLQDLDYPILSKPYRLSDLAQAIERALGTLKRSAP